jgi:tetratricopeptide (TPR) repeat protein
MECATEQFRLLLQQNPDSAPTHILMGEALDGLGQTPEAIKEFEAAEKISPNEPNVHFGLGYLHWKSHEYDVARQEFEQELAVDPANAQALAYLGDMEWKNDHPEAALSLLVRAVKINDSLRIVHTDLGAIYLQQKEYKSAKASDCA